MHSSASSSLLLLIMLAARGGEAQFPFGEPPNAPVVGPPPGMGELLGELRVLEEPHQLKEMINSQIVSLVLFTEGEEETPDTQWFMYFSTVVERSTDVKAGDARVNWGMADNDKLRKSSAPYQVREAGIWLFCDASDASGIRLPMKVLSDEDTRAAATWILGALDAAKAERHAGIWHKWAAPTSAAARTAPPSGDKSEL